MDIKLKPLHEQVMVITGASSGIGLATALAAAEAGARLVLAARSERTLSEVCRAIEARGGQAEWVTADVGNRGDIEGVVTAAMQRFGRIDTWVNNAGVSIYGRLEEVSEADSRRLFETNFWGVVNGSLAALPLLARQGGALINVGSEVSEAVIPLQGMYSASKHAVKGFTDALRIELQIAEAPVSVTLIQPTAVNTPYPEHARNYMEMEAALPTPQIEPERVADAILDAATHERRDVKVGGAAKLNTLISRIAPKVGDRMAARMAGRQQHHEPPRDPEGTLYRPGEAGRVHGEGAPRA